MIASDSGPVLPLVDESARLARQALVNCVGLFASAAVGLLLVPIMLHNLGRTSYGSWIAMESALAMLSRVDLGLNWAVTRELSASSEARPDSKEFVREAFTLAIVIGAAGWIGMAVIGKPLGAALQVSQALRTLFAIGGAIFLFETVRTLALSILRGLRRFDLTNAIQAVAAVIWGAGATALLLSGSGLITIVIWQAVSSVAALALAILVVSRCRDRVNLRLKWPSAAVLRGRIEFSLGSQLISLVGGSISEIPPLLIGVILGAPQIVPYYVGRTLPYSASAFAWRSAEVVFPAASSARLISDRNSAAAVLDTGTRLNLLAMIPISAVLWVCAPSLLRLWMGAASAEALVILRIFILVEIADVASLGSSTVLWALGSVRTLLAIDLATAAAVTGLAFAMVIRSGPTGAAVALLLTISAASAACIIIASRACSIAAGDLIRKSCSGLGLPALACLAFALTASWLTPEGSLVELATVSIAGAIAYLAVLQLRGARSEEREIIRSVAELVRRSARQIVTGIAAS